MIPITASVSSKALTKTLGPNQYFTQMLSLHKKGPLEQKRSHKPLRPKRARELKFPKKHF